jgi:hypothetical protein
MAPIRRRPEPTKKELDFIEAADKNIPAATESLKPNNQGEKVVNLRIPADLLTEIDQSIKNRRPAPSRHQWLLEAVYEKLEREQARDS